MQHENMTPETRLQYPEIPWKLIAGMRDMAAHKYQTLRLEDVYNTAKIDFPELLEQLNALLKEVEE